MNLYRIGVKVACRTGQEIPLVDFIPVFHRWIQTDAIDGMLIDVADYSHVPEGPGVILVANEGIYSIDETAGRRGLSFARRRPYDGSTGACLADVVCAAVKACRLLEQEFSGEMAFVGDEIEVFAQDRLLAPNTESTYRELRPDLETLARRLYPAAKCGLLRDQDARNRFSVIIRGDAETAFSDLAARLSL